MRWLLFLLASLACLDGIVAYVSATTVFQQIAALITLLSSAVLFCGAAIVDSIVNLKQEIRKISDSTKDLAKLRERVTNGSKPFVSKDNSAQDDTNLKQTVNAVSSENGNRIAWIILAFLILFIIGLVIFQALNW